MQHANDHHTRKLAIFLAIVFLVSGLVASFKTDRHQSLAQSSGTSTLAPTHTTPIPTSLETPYMDGYIGTYNPPTMETPNITPLPTLTPSATP